MAAQAGGRARLARALVAALAAVGLPGRLAAQSDPIARAADFERRGNHAGAAEQYRLALADRPADVTALLGLERTLGQLGKAGELVGPARAALRADAKSAVVAGIALRAYAAADFIDSLRPITERWAALDPADEDPWRELGLLLAQKRDRAGARAAFLLARPRTGKPDALAPELAQLAGADGDWAGAAAEWARAVRRVSGYRTAAVTQLAGAPEAQRAAVLATFRAATEAPVRRVAADPLIRWGDPVAGAALIRSGLPDDGRAAGDVLRATLETLRGIAGRDARRAQGLLLEALASRSLEPAATRASLDAAQAYAEAGALEDARRLLQRLASAGGGPPGTAVAAARTLITVLADEGKVDEAEQLLERGRETLDTDERLALRRRLALGWVRQGRFDRAEAVIAADSSVEAAALRGRFQLLRGDLKGAVAWFQGAGPYAGTREESQARFALVALIQPIEADSLPALGAALLRLERGDTTGAATDLEALAGTLPPEKGGSELMLHAGRLSAARGDRVVAERRLRAAAAGNAPTTAPAAELELGRLLIALGRGPEAVPVLEHLIVTYAGSALVPQARRLLDEARGAVPPKT
ncbi:MAG: hypothetical protein NW201_13015 [Gemmatimonadales bacterium]|nr:hypothetical protein [Gemmatimonadales bacterium]